MENQTLEQLISRETPYEDACKVLEMQPRTLEDFAFLPEDQRQYMHSVHRVVTVLDAAKKGDEKMDYDDYSQKKFDPWWDMQTYEESAEPGSGFSLDGVGCANAYTRVGSRLCTLSREKTRYIAEIMHDDYRVIMKG